MIYRQPRDTCLVVRNGLAGAQWEAHWAREQGSGARAWKTPAFIAYDTWRRETWERSRSIGDRRALLAPHQSAALWRTVIEESAVGSTLLNPGTSARWAALAYRLLADWRVDAATLRAGAAQGDYRALLAWLNDYANRLVEFDWVDEAATIGSVHAHELAVPGSVALLDLFELTPAQRSLFDALGRAGWEVESAAPPAVAGRAVKLQLAEPQQELAAAAQWAAARLARSLPTRVALVVHDARNRTDEVVRVLSDALGHVGPSAVPSQVGLQHGASLRTRPVIGAALDGIELLSPRGTFVTLSRWLRSPFFHGDAGEQARAALAEAALRAGIASQLGFLTAYEHGGLRMQLEREAAGAAAALAGGLREARSTGRLATPTKWAATWSRSLKRLGWPTPEGTLDDAGLRGWEDVLALFAQLTPVLGEITLHKALDELETLLDQPGAVAPLPRYGVHVLDHVDAVGPGYDAVWVLGLTDQQWPERGRLNPLLPHDLQTAHAMPWAAPGEAVGRAHASMERLLRRTEDVVCSWPAHVHEASTEPSPAILGLEPAVGGDFVLGARPSNHTPSVRPTELIEDLAPPFDGPHIEGGAHTLNLQARCPLRAFCETRLHARALEPPSRGLNPRAQGIALHRALELLVRGHSSQESMRAIAGGSRLAQRQCAEQALLETFGAARSPLAALFEIERDRIAGLLDAFLLEEIRRPPFAALKLEERTRVPIGPWTVHCRIDRIDQLVDGGVVLLDYKTGRSAGSPGDWFGDRLTETQLPLYALEVGPALTGIMMVVIASEGIVYRGVASAPERIANALRLLPEDRSWTEQVEIWHAQIRQLVDEFVGGDVRIYPHDCADAQGAYAPLTRVYASIYTSAGEPNT